MKKELACDSMRRRVLLCFASFGEGAAMELQTSLLELKGVGAKKYEALNKIGLFTVYDLLSYYPRT